MPPPPRTTRTGRAVRPAKPSTDQAAVLVVGSHPAAYVAALKLAALKVPFVLAAGSASHDHGRRLASVNPLLFDLLGPLAAVRKAVPHAGVRSVVLHDAGGRIAETTPAFAGSDLPLVMDVSALTSALRDLCDTHGVRRIGHVRGLAPADGGVTFASGRSRDVARVLLVTDGLAPEEAHALGMASGTPVASHLYILPNPTPAGVAHVALDLADGTAWGVLLSDGTHTQIAAYGRLSAGLAPLREFAARLHARVVVTTDAVDGRAVRSWPVRPGGAFERETVGRGTLACGPLGGFVTTTGEEMFPACRSAVLAAAVAAKAARAEHPQHPQDVLATFRAAWGGAMGEYLQGPQQNMGLLLPLAFKKPVMADRLADALFRGMPLVR